MAKALDPVFEAIAFNAEGLVPAIAQQHDSGAVLMMAWMNRAAVAETLETGRVCYFSRSRGRLWRKGESSGQVQRLVELRWIATATRCCCWSIRRGSPATRAG